MARKVLVTCLWFLVVSGWAYAATDTVIPKDQLLSIAAKQQWKHLLHYHQVGLFSADQSQADDPDFFLSEEGVHDPLAELVATYIALATNTDDAQCRFPARLHWLNQQLDKPIPRSADCSDFEKWRDEISPSGLTLVFPAAYLNSPSSMYGHTFFRIDSARHSNPLLDYSINYAANADPQDNELVFTYKGLSGGYPGVFSVLPYYEKVKEYSYLEARDVWEYRIDISQAELEQLVRHAWEIKDTHFDYYFFTENCSYHLLTLLDAASERFNLSDTFTSNVIPADTVRAVMDAGLIQQAEFRPSSLTQMKHMQTQMTDEAVEYSKALVDGSMTIEALEQTLFSLEERAQILDLAYHYSRYLALKEKSSAPGLARKSLGLLSARSKIAVSKVFQDVRPPEIRDDEGHYSHRHQVKFGHHADGNYLEYGLRAAYHDWLDNIPGYISGSQLEMFHLRLRHYLNEDTNLRIEEFRALDIASITPRTTLLKPISWFVNTGIHRELPANDELMPYLNAGFGVSYGTGNNAVSALLDTQLDADSDIDKGHYLASGPRLLWLSQHESWSASVDVQHLFDISGAKWDHFRANTGISFALDRHSQIRFVGEYQRYKLEDDPSKAEDLSAAVSFIKYF